MYIEGDTFEDLEEEREIVGYCSECQAAIRSDEEFSDEDELLCSYCL